MKKFDQAARRIDLGLEALSYLRSSLESWGNTLSKLALEKDLENGRCWTLLPENVSDIDAKQISSGGKSRSEAEFRRLVEETGGWVEVQSTEKWCYSIIQKYLAAGENRLCFS